MRSDIERGDRISVDTENHPQVALNDRRIDRLLELRGKSMDAVRSQSGIERILPNISQARRTLCF